MAQDHHGGNSDSADLRAPREAMRAEGDGFRNDLGIAWALTTIAGLTIMAKTEMDDRDYLYLHFMTALANTEHTLEGAAQITGIQRALDTLMWRYDSEGSYMRARIYHEASEALKAVIDSNNLRDKGN
jgi:hypothetical protein